MTPKQRRFVEEYLCDLNATQAAIRAGYSVRTARKIGHENLTKPDIAAAVQEARIGLSKRVEITQERVMQEYARIAFADIRDLFEWDEDRAAYVPSKDLTADQAAAISAVEAETRHFHTEAGTETTIKLKLKTYDKKGALDSIAKIMGFMSERTINVDVASLSTEELERIAQGEDPLSVLADTRAG